MSIRLRLTLWYTAVLAAVLVAFGLALYYVLTSSLLSSIDRDLEEGARRVAASARLRLAYLSLETVLETPALDVVAAPGLYVQVVDGSSGQIARSTTLGGGTLPLDEAVREAVLAGQQDWRTTRIGGTSLRILSAPVSLGGQVVGIVQVAASLDQLDQTRQQLITILVSIGLIAILISALSGALLARSGLRPIDAITQTALSISHTEDLHQRLDVSGPADEVGRLAATFNEMLARLEGLFHTQQRFLADVSHELRTPLTIIQGNLDLLRQGAAGDALAQSDMLKETAEEVARMSRLVADLLLLARVDAGARLEFQPVELDTLLLEVYRQARVMSRGAEVLLGHEDQAVVQGDADRLRQLLLNLVDNALSYTPTGGHVTLSLYQEGEWVRVTIADNGIGIPPEDLQPGPDGLPLIFQRFYRADLARSRVGGGTGLGLSIAQWIAQAHGGQITVESQVGTGSTFTVRLPAGPGAPMAKHTKG